MTPEQRAREFVTDGFKGLGIADLEPYIQIVTELIEGAIDDERKHIADMLAALRGALVIIETAPWPDDISDGVRAAFDERHAAIKAAIAKATG